MSGKEYGSEYHKNSDSSCRVVRETGKKYNGCLIFYFLQLCQSLNSSESLGLAKGDFGLRLGSAAGESLNRMI